MVDSIGTVMMALYDLLIPTGDTLAEQLFLLCVTSRITIARARRMLSETRIRVYGTLEYLMEGTSQSIPRRDRRVS